LNDRARAGTSPGSRSAAGGGGRDSANERRDDRRQRLGGEPVTDLVRVHVGRIDPQRSAGATAQRVQEVEKRDAVPLADRADALVRLLERVACLDAHDQGPERDDEADATRPGP
jgi:hypothetical protein